MSGPIIRKYGFPNFEKIFGDRGLQHGTDEEKPPTEGEAPPATPGAAASKPEPIQTGELGKSERKNG